MLQARASGVRVARGARAGVRHRAGGARGAHRARTTQGERAPGRDRRGRALLRLASRDGKSTGYILNVDVVSRSHTRDETRASAFVTCLGDTLFPEAPARARARARTPRPRGQFRASRAAAPAPLNRGYRDEAPDARRFERVSAGFDVIVSPSSSCVGAVREAGSEHCRACSSSLSCSCDKLGRRGRRRALPAPGRDTTDLRLAARHAGGRRRRGSGRGAVARSRPRPPARCGRVLRLPRHLLMKNVDTSSAMLADKSRAVLDTGAEARTAVDGSRR